MLSKYDYIRMSLRFLVWACVLLSSTTSSSSTTTPSSSTALGSSNSGRRKSSDDGMPSPFSIVIDGGSTGSRLHIFEFVVSNSNTSTSVECVRRGSVRANVPLSAFAPTPDEPILNATYVAQHILELFEYAATIVPQQYHATTHATYQATAGMRLLDEIDQQAVYDALYTGLMASESFVFDRFERRDIATLSGELEGFYGALAANYLKGIIDANLHTIATTHNNNNNNIEEPHGDHHGPIGALDMGGSSTQIVFLPETAAATTPTSSTTSATRIISADCNDNEWDRATCFNDDDDEEPDSTPTSRTSLSASSSTTTPPQRLNGDDFFSTSYLSYGVDQFRERLWSTWIQDHLLQEHQQQQQQNDDSTDSCDSRILTNPCAFKGYVMDWQGFTLVGTGDTDECIRQIQRLIPHAPSTTTTTSASQQQQRRRHVVGGVEHPPIRGKFYAMSLYFFTLDSLRVLSSPHREAHEALNLSWPTPSLQELHHALYGLCSRHWFGDLYEIQHDSPHQYTRAEVLPHRCFESVYMVTLLRDGFGFDPQSRDITFAFLVDGSEVEWSLGMALALHAERRDLQQQPQPIVDRMIESQSKPMTHNHHRHSVDSNLTTDDDVNDNYSNNNNNNGNQVDGDCCGCDDDDDMDDIRTSCGTHPHVEECSNLF